MGFGLLFIGYLLTFLLSMAGGYGAYPAIVGCIVMLYAMTKLVDYEPRFKYAFFSVMPMALCVAFDLSVAVSALLGGYLPGFLGWSVTADVVKYAKFVFELVFHIALLSSVAKIALDTGIEKTARAAWRNLIIYGVYFATAVVSSFLPGSLPIAPYLLMAQFLLYLIWMILNSVALFSCYMRICDEGDQEMKAKPSRFAFVNRFREEYDRREANAQKTQREYREQKMKKRIEQVNKNKANYEKKKRKKK